jgi:hypothetical protein
MRNHHELVTFFWRDLARRSCPRPRYAFCDLNIMDESFKTSGRSFKTELPKRDFHIFRSRLEKYLCKMIFSKRIAPIRSKSSDSSESCNGNCPTSRATIALGRNLTDSFDVTFVRESQKAVNSHIYMLIFPFRRGTLQCGEEPFLRDGETPNAILTQKLITVLRGGRMENSEEKTAKRSVFSHARTVCIWPTFLWVHFSEGFTSEALQLIHHCEQILKHSVDSWKSERKVIIGNRCKENRGKGKMRNHSGILRYLANWSQDCKHKCKSQRNDWTSDSFQRSKIDQTANMFVAAHKESSGRQPFQQSLGRLLLGISHWEKLFLAMPFCLILNRANGFSCSVNWVTAWMPVEWLEIRWKRLTAPNSA